MPRTGNVAPVVFVAASAGAVLLIGVVSALVAVFSAASGSEPSAPSPPPLPVAAPIRPVPTPIAPEPPAPLPPPPPLQLDSRVCLLADATGDGVRELGVLVSRGRSESTSPALIDGASGEPVWTAGAIPEGDRQILCLGDRYFGAVDQDRFELFLQSTSGPTQIRRALSDEVNHFGATESCIALRTEDRNVVGFSLEDGSETSCSAQLSRRPHLDYDYTCEIISTISRPTTAAYEDMRYEVLPRRPGTPFLEVSGYRGREQLWTQTTRFIPVNGEAIGCIAIAGAPGMGVILGTTRGGGPWGNGVAAIGFDASEGIERYATSLTGSGATSLRGMTFNGRYVIVGLGRDLVAVEPATGAIAWRFAR